MLPRRVVSKFLIFLMLLIVCIAGIDRSVSRHLAAAPAIVPCKDITTLRDLSSSVRTSSDSRTGHTIEYLLVGDGASSNQVLVFFDGTSQVMADWPTQMITNKDQSPLIAFTPIYSDSENGPISLCHNYRMLFFDYPAVGLSTSGTNYSTAQVADDVDALLAEVGNTFSIPTNDVSLIGWSLGSLAALKYATLSPAANPTRTTMSF